MARALPFDAIASASAQECAAILAAVAARLAVLEPASSSASGSEADELIDAQETSRILKCSVSTVQHKAKVAPLKYARVTSLGRGLLFSRRKVERLIEREAGRDTSLNDIGLRGLNSGRRRPLAIVDADGGTGQ